MYDITDRNLLRPVEGKVNISRLANSLFVAVVNIAIAAAAFVLFIYPRFTNIGARLTFLMLLLFVIDVILVLRDLCRSGTRIRAVIAAFLWLPLFFFLLMVVQWEGPLNVAVEDYPPHFQACGLAMFCGIAVYGPEQGNPEWYGDDVGLIWEIKYAAGRHPVEASFKYGEVPHGFTQEIPAGKLPPLDPNVNYKLAVNPCMGEPQYFTLHGSAISEYKSSSNVCWGSLKVPGQNNAALVRVDCKSLQALSMSERAKERLKAYQEHQIPYY
jgi:hypothetical protein